MSVKYVRPEVTQLKPIYRKIRDVLAGPSAIKAAGSLYLPIPDPSDTSIYAVPRYNNYLERAIFFDATARTHDGFVGQMFYRETQIELPPVLEFMRANVDGQGTTLEQQAKNVAGEVLGLGRAGLYVDYTAQDGVPISIADQEKAKVRPIVTRYAPERIINWRYTTIETTRFLSLVVLEEKYQKEDDGFEVHDDWQYRELRMVFLDGRWQFRCRVWRDEEIYSETFPKRGDGQVWERITFEFIGAQDNDAEIDKPPLEGMAEINIGHYRNSAEYEEMIFMSGQPTPYATNISDMWMKEHWNNELRLGCREFIALPQDATMGLLQMAVNTMAKEGMDAKEKQLVALGAKIAENKTTTTTATEENRDSVIENSVLSSVAKNTSSAYSEALKLACIYSNIPVTDKTIVFEINTDFELTRLSPQDRTQLLAEWQGGGITWEEYRWNMKRGGVAYLDDNKAKDLIAAEQEDNIDLEAKRVAATTPVEPVVEEVPPKDE